ncbi:MAG: DUF2249 domain-containing protein [Gammaproteobacteria bacterium]|nr:DUF2249 domain-containing protein [Gammaproteobacteria bacterium]
MSGEILLDVSDLPPPEPMERILTALESLSPGDWLCVLIHRQPWPLLPELEALGYAWRMQDRDPPGFEILIWRAGDADADTGANARAR